MMMMMMMIIIIIVSIRYAQNIWFYLLNKEIIINERKLIRGCLINDD